MTRFIPSRYRLLLWMAATFLLINLAVRIGLALFDRTAVSELTTLGAVRVFATGLIYDLAALSWALVPAVIVAFLCTGSRRGRRVHAVLASIGIVIFVAGLLFIALAEFVFWNEFAARFNFIAVDYLVYTHEVVGNIRQSYPAGWLLGGIGVIALVIVAFYWRRISAWAGGEAGAWWHRLALTVLLMALPVASFFGLGDEAKESLPNPASRELAGNGPYEFMRAFRSNDLDYLRYYRTLPDDRALAIVGAARPLGQVAAAPARSVPTMEPRPKHIVLVSIESMGSDNVESFGGTKGLTPHLDRLGREGLKFTDFYATGLRTVRGLEALTLSMPPTPGHAVPMRHDNKGFPTLGGTLKAAGYDPIYVYGGYSRFDNMLDFFGGNGYTVIDRSAIDAADIHHETIWGVADEDLFALTVREIDRRAAAGTQVFAHVMTTSNHRPYTYPAERIDIPSGSSADGAVKYTDWAIGEFVRVASQRPWFADTLFVFVADHTSNGRGRTDLPPENYQIPLILYAPGRVAPKQIDTLSSQIDVGPTVLGLVGVPATNAAGEPIFIGQDILRDGPSNPRAFLANYLTVGYLKDGVVVELRPKQRVDVIQAGNGKPLAAGDTRAARFTEEAIAHYQVAAQVLKRQQRIPARGVAVGVAGGVPGGVTGGVSGDVVGGVADTAGSVSKGAEAMLVKTPAIVVPVTSRTRL